MRSFISSILCSSYFPVNNFWMIPLYYLFLIPAPSLHLLQFFLPDWQLFYFQQSPQDFSFSLFLLLMLHRALKKSVQGRSCGLADSGFSVLSLSCIRKVSTQMLPWKFLRLEWRIQFVLLHPCFSTPLSVPHEWQCSSFAFQSSRQDSLSVCKVLLSVGLPVRDFQFRPTCLHQLVPAKV